MAIFNGEDESNLGTVLVVDDEAAIRDLLENWLEVSGFEVKTASNGAEALEMAKEVNPDAIVMDASMPIMSGFEALAEFKRRPELCNLPVMMLTVHNEVRDIVSALDMGASDYMSKPFNPQVLMARLRALIRLRNATMDASDNARFPLVMVILDKNGQITGANEAAQQLWGSALVGITLTEIWPWMKDTPWVEGQNYCQTLKDITIGENQCLSCQVSGMAVNGAYVLTLGK